MKRALSNFWSWANSLTNASARRQHALLRCDWLIDLRTVRDVSRLALVAEQRYPCATHLSRSCTNETASCWALHAHTPTSVILDAVHLTMCAIPVSTSLGRLDKKLIVEVKYRKSSCSECHTCTKYTTKRKKKVEQIRCLAGFRSREAKSLYF